MKVDYWAPAPGRIANPLTWSLKRRLRYDRNTMLVYIGDPRSGKSNSASLTGEEMSLNRPFSAKDIAFLPQDYIHRLSVGTPGDYVEFDETAAEYSNRDAMTRRNKMLNATHVTFGSKYITVGWALPVLQMQDAQSRMLVRYVFEHAGEGPRGRGVRFYQNWVDHWSGKTGRTYKGLVWFAKAWIGRPEEAKEYREMKAQYQDASYSKYVREFEKTDDAFADKANEMNSNIAKAVAEIPKNPMPYTNSRGRIDRRYIKREFHLTDDDAGYVANTVNKKLGLLKDVA